MCCDMSLPSSGTRSRGAHTTWSEPPRRSLHPFRQPGLIAPRQEKMPSGGLLPPDRLRRNGAVRCARPLPGLGGSGDRRGELQLDVVRVAERQDVDAEPTEARDLAVRDATLVEQSGGLLQLCPAGDAEAQVVESDAVIVEPVALWRHGPQPEQQVAGGHHDATPQDPVRRFGRRIVGRRRLDGYLEAEHAGVELPTALDVSHGQAQVMYRPDRKLYGHSLSLSVILDAEDVGRGPPEDLVLLGLRQAQVVEGLHPHAQFATHVRHITVGAP